MSAATLESSFFLSAIKVLNFVSLYMVVSQAHIKCGIRLRRSSGLTGIGAFPRYRNCAIGGLKLKVCGIEDYKYGC